MDESTDQPLIGESSFTENLLTKFEMAFNEMSNDAFNLETLHKKISNNTPVGCNNIPDPHIVILAPGEPPSCDKNVHAACEMYRSDLQISNSNNEKLYINIACDQAI